MLEKMRIFKDGMEKVVNVAHKLASVSNKLSVRAANNIGAFHDDMDMISQQLLIFIYFTKFKDSYNYYFEKTNGKCNNNK